MNKPIRHGEVMLIPESSMPKTKATKYDAYIVGHSETGHHHVLQADMEIAVEKEDLYVRLFQPGKLVHKKTVNRHNDLTVAPGVYKVVRKKEYGPFEKIMREVWD
jgi:hypothetical protein